MTATHVKGDPTKRAVLDGLGVETFDHIIVLADKDEPDLQRADSRTLVTLLQLRDMSEVGGFDLNIVSEMLDDTNRELAEVTEADDFIVSDKLIALLLSQVSENRKLTEVFDTLFSSASSEIYLNPAADYITPGSTVDFYAVPRGCASPRRDRHRLPGRCRRPRQRSGLRREGEPEEGRAVHPRPRRPDHRAGGGQGVTLA